ncbi:unnamed protein product [Polarella glacialis]|uniref:Ion transport domain-containing protein n=1 Tax=Polarella glacialis TaxID=89957 RepID=A0A813EW80_POLGL|nr:unnamed protein product [Polarella glacialis]
MEPDSRNTLQDFESAIDSLEKSVGQSEASKRDASLQKPDARQAVRFAFSTSSSSIGIVSGGTSPSRPSSQSIVDGLRELRSALTHSHDQVLGILNEELVKAKQIEGEMAALRAENLSLRENLQAGHVAAGYKVPCNKPDKKVPDPRIEKGTSKVESSRPGLKASFTEDEVEHCMLPFVHPENEKAKVSLQLSGDCDAELQSSVEIEPRLERPDFKPSQTAGDGTHSQSKHRKSWLPEKNSSKPKNRDDAVPHLRLTRDERTNALQEGTEAMDRGVLTGVNPEYAKQMARQALKGQDFPVKDELKTTGVFQYIVRHPMFERVTMAMIAFNALWMAIDAEYNHADVITMAEIQFQVAENLSCAYFFFELLFRFMAYATARSCLHDSWFLFDLLLVLVMVLETWLLPLVMIMSGTQGTGLMGGQASVLRAGRLLRILRTARMARLVRLMPELMILVKGMFVACRSVFFTLVLLQIIIYIFAIAFMQISKESEMREKYFDGMGKSMFTLLVYGILPDQEPFITDLAGDSWMLTVLVLVFILLGSLTVMNMLLGVLVEAVKTVSVVEREQLDVNFAKKILLDLIKNHNLDADGDNLISEQEFMDLLSNPQAARCLASLGVDVIGAIDCGSMLFEDGEPLTFSDFMHGMLMLRGTNTTTVKDIIDLRRFVAEEFEQVSALVCLQIKNLTSDSPDANESEFKDVRIPRSSRSPRVRAGSGPLSPTQPPLPFLSQGRFRKTLAVAPTSRREVF